MVTALQRKLLRDLGRQWAPLLAAALVMCVGIGAITMSLSALESLRRAMDSYYDAHRFPHIFAGLKRAPRTVAARLAEVPGVQRVVTRVVVDVNLNVPGLLEPATGRIISIPDAPPFGLSELYLRRGRFPEPGRAGEVIANEGFMEAHGFALGQDVAAVMHGRLQRLTIVGVALSPEYIYQIRPGELLPDDRRFGVFWIPYRELAPAFDLDGSFNDAVFAISPGVERAAVIDAVDGVLREYGGGGAYGRNDQTSHRYITDEMSQLRGMAVIPPAIFLTAAAFILNIAFSRLIQTQREQAATLRAFGYTTGQVARHYLLMVLVVACVGSLLGMLLGWRLGLTVTRLYTQFFRFPTLEFSLYKPGVVLAIAAGAGASVLGTYTAIARAAALPPAQAMRPPAPTDYRITLMQRMGITGVISPMGRMVVRHLERQPVRAAMTVLGIALALAVLIMGSYAHGAVNYLMDFQFRLSQRQHLTVVFNEPASPAAVHALARLPGVITTEPFRAVPARLRSQHHSRREPLMGLVGTPTLNRVISDREVPIGMPAEGLLLSDSMADMLRVRPGDTVRVEVLEGPRPERTMMVAGRVPTYMGTGVYLSRGGLNRLMREGAVISGANLTVDSVRGAELYAMLKETPGVAGVTVKDAARVIFRETFARNILIMRAFNLIFASTIAFGVIFNSARVALAERAHELATMRILGFTRREVLTVIAGELATLTVLAIPIGLVLGRLLTLYAASAMRTETHRIPAMIDPGTYAFGTIAIFAALAVAVLVLRRGIHRLDLIEVLKSKG